MGAGGRDVIAAIVAGYEIQIRLSLALVPKDHYDRGFHPTATCGVFGAAAAAGRVFGMSADEIVSLANTIIGHNTTRMDKTCFSEKQGGTVAVSSCSRGSDRGTRFIVFIPSLERESASGMQRVS